jgi:hypothetical protein
MFHKRIVFVTLTLALSLGVGRAAADGDGDVERDRGTAPPARAIGCTPGATFCPAYPSTLRISRAEFLEQLRGLSGCSDEEEPVKERRLREAGDAASVTTALAHLVLADPNLSLHDVKNAVDLIAGLRSGNGLQALQAIYDQSDALVSRTIEGGPVAAFDREAQADYTRRQAEELRRIVVLAIAKDGSSGATSLLRQATSDAGRSVASTAARALESRRR